MRALMHTVAALLLASSLTAAEINRTTVLEAMNRHRERAGAAALREDPRLMAAAEDRMRDMEELGYWAHESPDGRSPFALIPRRGYDFRTVGENLAAGFETAELLVESWMESPGHRDNILSTSFEDCGIAVIEGSTTGPATGRSIVVLFGTAKK